MHQAGSETFEVAYSAWLVRLCRSPLVVYTVGGLTGVSITCCPYFLYVLGREGASFTDWRVMLCAAVAYFIPFVYIRLGGVAMEAIWKSRAKRPSATP